MAQQKPYEQAPIAQQANHLQIWRLPTVMEITALSRSSIYAKVADGTFPAPVKLGERAVGWRSTDVNNWLSGL